MITNKGKSILAKYLINQAPAYASYIAFGCGPKAVTSSTTFTDAEQEAFANKTALDFEMFRAPITSRGYVTQNVLNENGEIQLDANNEPETISQIVFTAELPTDERYEITEMGIFSAGSNPSAGSTDSKILNTFSESENWEYHYKNVENDIVTYPARKINVISGKLDTGTDNIIDDEQGGVELDVFRTNANNILFEDTSRILRNERCRFFNSMLMIRGDACRLFGSNSSNLYVDPENNSHIHFNGLNFNLDKNAGTDVIKLAFSIINKNGSSQESPGAVRIMIEFASSESALGESQQYARLKGYLELNDISTNRYHVISSSLENLEKTAGFSWAAVEVVKIYASVATPAVNNEVSPTSISEQYYIALDALRLENVTTVNPLYGLTAYTVIKNEGGLPIIKNPNSSTLAEFRFGIDILGDV